MADFDADPTATPEPSPADRAVWRALQQITQGDDRTTADPHTPAGQAELGSLYAAKARAAWEELRHAHRARPDTPAMPEEILSVDAFLEIADDFSALLNIAIAWSDQILAEAATRTGTALTQGATLQPPLTWSLAHLLARHGESVATVLYEHVLDTLRTEQARS